MLISVDVEPLFKEKSLLRFNIITKGLCDCSADCVIVSPRLNKFQVLRDLRETYPCSDCELSSCNHDASTFVVLESPSKVMTSTHFPSQKKSKELTVYTRRKNRKIFFAVPEIGFDTAISEIQRRALSFASDSLAKQCFGGRCGPSTCFLGCFDNLGDGSMWVQNHIMEFCDKMGLKVGGKDNEVLIS